MVLKGKQPEISDRPVELNEEINIAAGGGLVSRDRAEQGQRPNAELPGKLGLSFSQDADNLGALHSTILT
jgi:hypothetical protein